MRVKWETPEAQALSDKIDRWIRDEKRERRGRRESGGDLFVVMPSLEGVGPGGERSVR